MRRLAFLLLLAGGARGDDGLAARTEATLAELDLLVQAEREGGRGAEADVLAYEVLALRRRIAERIAPGPSKETEMHVVHVRGAPEPGGRRALVRVTLRARPVVLVLGSSGPVNWHVAATGADVRRIVTIGHEDHLVIAEPRVPVEELRKHLDLDTPATLARQIEDATGGVVATLTGAEERDPAQPFVIGPENPEWFAQHVHGEAVRLHWRATRARRAALREQLKKERFRFLYRWREGRTLRASFGDWTPLGPLLARQVLLSDLLAVSSAAVEDAEREEVYLLRARALIRFPLPKGPPEVVRVPDTLPQVLEACALAIDTRRHRLLLATRHELGYLYALDLRSRQWSVVNDLDGVDAAGMAYDERRDAILIVEHGKDGALTLQRFSPEEGRRLHATRLLLPALREERPLFATCLGAGLVLLYPPPDSEAHRIGEDTLAFVIEPHSGNVLLGGRVRPWEDFEPVPEARFGELWDAMLTMDHDGAERAMRVLAGQGDAAVAFLAKRFTPQPGTDEELGRWVRMLSEDDTLVRDLAQHRLVLAGPRAVEYLAGLDLDALSPEARRRVTAALQQVEEPGRLRRSLRAIRVIEAIETPAAEALLRELAAKGEARRASAAAEALGRIGAPRR